MSTRRFCSYNYNTLIVEITSCQYSNNLNDKLNIVIEMSKTRETNNTCTYTYINNCVQFRIITTTFDLLTAS